MIWATLLSCMRSPSTWRDWSKRARQDWWGHFGTLRVGGAKGGEHKKRRPGPPRTCLWVFGWLQAAPRVAASYTPDSILTRFQFLSARPPHFMRTPLQGHCFFLCIFAQGGWISENTYRQYQHIYKHFSCVISLVPKQLFVTYVTSMLLHFAQLWIEKRIWHNLTLTAFLSMLDHCVGFQQG